MVQGDPYEEDDSAVLAREIAANLLPETHHFHDLGDEDWVSFYAEAGVIYTIRAQPRRSPCDPVLAIYQISNPTIPLAPTPQDDHGPGEVEELIWTCPETGDYLLQIKDYDPLAIGYGSEYDLSIITEFGLTNAQANALSSRRLQITWTPSTRSGIQFTRIYRSESGGVYTQIAQVAFPTNEYEDTDLEPATNYSYIVREYDTALNRVETSCTGRTLESWQTPNEEPSPTPTFTTTSTFTPTYTVTETPTPTTTISLTPTITETITNTITETPTYSPTASETATLMATPTSSLTVTPTPTVTMIPTPTMTEPQTGIDDWIMY